MPKEIRYLDNIIRKEELQLEKVNETKRRFSISRSGRFKSKNKQREAIDLNLYNNPGNVDNNQSHHSNNSQSMSYKKHNTDHVHHSKEMIASG